MERRRVVITGIGAITPIGNNIEEMWKNVQEGVCGIDEITLYDTSNQQVHLAGEVKGYDPLEYFKKKEAKKKDRFVQFGIIASREAVEDSALDLETEDLDRCGVVMATGIGGITTIEREHSKGLEKGFDKVSPYYIPMAIANMVAGNISIEFGFRGKSESVSTACASGTNAVGDAFREIAHGYADVMIAGGAESSITPLSVGGFTSLRALSTSTDKDRASIPFDKERDGFVIAEGAGSIILEEYEHAKARGAHIYAELVGYATNDDANHVTAPLEDGSGAAKCMKLAVKDAGIELNQIDYINTHGTSTPLNDKGETKAVKLAFGEHAKSLCMSSTKSMTGHMLGASGAVEAIISALASKNDFVPATINYKVADEECDLDVVPNEGRNMPVNYVLSNSLGFGGHNASLIIKKY